MPSMQNDVWHNRIERLRKIMDSEGISLFLTASLSNVYYLTDYLETGDATLFLIMPIDGAPTLFVNEMNVGKAENDIKNCLVEPVRKHEKYTERVVGVVCGLTPSKIAFDELSSSSFNVLSRHFNGRLVQRSEALWQLRRVKDEHELTIMKKAGDLTSTGAKAALDAVDVGKREFEVAADAEYAMRKRGAGGTAFDTIIASGPRSAWPHGTCDDRKIQKGDAVVIDMGAVYKGYRSDITRTTFVGPLTERQKEVYKAVLAAQLEATKKAVNGVKTAEVDKVARSLIAEYGYEEYFTHGTGHGVGIDIHEPPRLTVTGEDVLVPGNVVTVEPGIYLPGSFGVRIEDTLLIKNEGNDVFTTCEKLMI